MAPERCADLRLPASSLSVVASVERCLSMRAPGCARGRWRAPATTAPAWPGTWPTQESWCRTGPPETTGSQRGGEVRSGRRRARRSWRAGPHTSGQPKTGAERAALQMRLTARRAAVEAATAAQRQLLAPAIAAPETVRARFRGQNTHAMLTVAALRSDRPRLLRNCQRLARQRSRRAPRPRTSPLPQPAAAQRGDTLRRRPAVHGAGWPEQAFHEPDRSGYIGNRTSRPIFREDAPSSPITAGSPCLYMPKLPPRSSNVTSSVRLALTH
jgi:hypothetical protein